LYKSRDGGKMRINHTQSERTKLNKISRLKTKQKQLRKKWLELDIFINKLQNEIIEEVGNKIKSPTRREKVINTLLNKFRREQ
jgi:hypothetical protein